MLVKRNVSIRTKSTLFSKGKELNCQHFLGVPPAWALFCMLMKTGQLLTLKQGQLRKEAPLQIQINTPQMPDRSGGSHYSTRLFCGDSNDIITL